MKILATTVSAFILATKTASASNSTKLDDGQIATTAVFSFFGALAMVTSALCCYVARNRYMQERRQAPQMPNMRTATVTPINSPRVAVASIVMVHQTPPMLTISQSHNIITSPA